MVFKNKVLIGSVVAIVMPLALLYIWFSLPSIVCTAIGFIFLLTVISCIVGKTIEKIIGL